MPVRPNRTSKRDFSVVPEHLMAHALDTFGSMDKDKSWLATPNPVLKDEEPIEIVRTAEGVKRVEEVLTRIDYGIFS